MTPITNSEIADTQTMNLHDAGAREKQPIASKKAKVCVRIPSRHFLTN